ncbi:MAG: hypothetical protein KGJ73_05650 [Rhodospirillales bacterium]|nr:hypothetical protein [Rhodospirillales bacterium]
MERKTAGLLGALAGLATLGGTAAQAATNVALTPEPLAVTSYADLLRPIPNAAAALRMHDAEMAQAKTPGAVKVDWNNNGDGNGNNHHHHHHHNSYYAPPPPPPHHHHHHHHHQGGAVIVAPGVGVSIN